MNVWTDSKRKWALESESNPEIKENQCIIKMCPIKRLTALIPIDANKLFSCSQSVQCKYNK